MRIWLSAPFPSVIHRSGSVTEVKLRLQGARQIQFCTIDGFRQCLAKRQMRCDRRRQRASGAMRVRIIDTTRAEPSDFAARFNEHIAGILRAMTAFDEHRCVARDERDEPADFLVGLICFMFELVYPASRALAREQGDIYRLLDAPFGITRPFTDPATQATWSRLKDKMRDWLARA